MVGRIVVALFVLICPATVSAESIVNKSDADHIFSINLNAWNAYAAGMTHPDGWKVKLSNQDTGITVMAFSPTTGMGMSIQPLYKNDVEPPHQLIVGSFYPKGSLPPFSKDFRKKLESEAQKDLGRNYSIRAIRADISTWDGIELILTRR